MRGRAPVILFCIASFLSPLLAAGQSYLHFHHHFQPELHYTFEHTTIASNALSYSGDEAFVSMMESAGTMLNQVSTDSSTLLMQVHTGPMNEASEFALEIHVLKSHSGISEMQIPEGLRIYGATTLAGFPRLDSISETGRGAEYEEALLTTMKGIFGQLKFPNRELELGDTFSDTVPLEIPIAGLSMELVTKSNYTLTELHEGEAHFDLVQDYALNSDIPEFSATASGEGLGTLIYDIEHQFITLQNSNIQMEMTIQFEAFSIHLNQAIEFVQNVTITR
ncbi:MAG: hypothetical protein RLP15_13615 [Cryomorphaceae bacterium]